MAAEAAAVANLEGVDVGDVELEAVGAPGSADADVGAAAPPRAAVDDGGTRGGAADEPPTQRTTWKRSQTAPAMWRLGTSLTNWLHAPTARKCGFAPAATTVGQTSAVAG